MTRPVAIVTGGLRGIGRACVQALADAGFDLVVADLPGHMPRDYADDLAARGARAAYRRFDLADITTHGIVASAALDEFGHIDCLVNNAGIASPVRGDLLDLEPANFDRVLSVNLRGTVFLTQAVVRAMLEQRPQAGSRAIVNITSLSADAASPERADYCMSKAALSMWTKLLTLRLAPENISVFEVRPGIIRTDMTAAVAAKYDALIDGGLVPMGRWGEARDIGDAVAALASGRMGFATGSVLNLDGGLAVPRL
jgi:NAD(P)-dependent dehydrogenase (short-subunit alcohol dehydrogenase family)